MLRPPAVSAELHYNTDAYWCAGCWSFTLDCSHLVEPLNTPSVQLHDWVYVEATWAKNILQVRTNTGEGYQFFNVPRWLAIAFVRSADGKLLDGHRFERVRGRIPIPERF